MTGNACRQLGCVPCWFCLKFSQIYSVEPHDQRRPLHRPCGTVLTTKRKALGTRCGISQWRQVSEREVNTSLIMHLYRLLRATAFARTGNTPELGDPGASDAMVSGAACPVCRAAAASDRAAKVSDSTTDGAMLVAADTGGVVPGGASSSISAMREATS